MFKKSMLIRALCLIFIALGVTSGTALADTTITIVLKDDGTTSSIWLDKHELTLRPDTELPPGRIIPSADLGKIYKFLVDKKNSRCVKRNCRWY